MKAQRQVVDMDECPGGKPAHRMLADTGKQRIAELVEADHQNAADGIGDNQHDRRQHKYRQESRAAAGAGQRVGDPFVGIGHQNGDNLGSDQRQKGNQHPALQIRSVGRPHIGPQIGDGLQRAAAISGDARRRGGGIGGRLGGRVSARHLRPFPARRRARWRQSRQGSDWSQQAPPHPASSASGSPRALGGSVRRP